MIDKFIDSLEKLLNQYEISKKEKNDIIDDYKQMIEDGKQKGLSQGAIIEMVGSPEKITSELGYKQKNLFPGGEKLIALSPFVSFIIFMILGLTKGLWHPGWLVFILIPVTAIIVEMGNSHEKYLLTALSPFISFTFFFFAGLRYELWHPSWLIFIIIPLLGIIESKHEMNNLTFYTALSPFISFIAFIFIGYFTGEYHLAWLTLLLVVVLGIFHEDKARYKILLFVTLALSILLYLAFGMYYENWIIASSAFAIFIITGILTGYINVEIYGLDDKVNWLIIFISIILFLGVGYLFNLWPISWLFLLIIPTTMIIKYREDKLFLTPLSPFFALTIFMLLGYYYDLWHISWIAFLLIPIIAIIEDKE